MALSQLLQGTDITFSPISNDRGEVTSNQGDAYAITKYKEQVIGGNKQIVSYLTLTENQEVATASGKKAIGQNSNLIFRNSIVSNTTSGAESSYSASWDRGFSGLRYDTNAFYSPNRVVINTPTSILKLESMERGDSVNFGENNTVFDIKAKTIYIGTGNSVFEESANLSVLKQDSKIQADLIVQKDGALTIGNIRENQKDSLIHFSLEGNLTIDGGFLRVASMGGGPDPIFDVSGFVDLKDARFDTFVKTNGLIENVRIVKGKKGIKLSGNNTMQTSVSYYLQDFMQIDKDHVDYGSASHAKVDLYKYDLEIVNNTLYAKPKLSEMANQKNIFELINDAKNKVAIMFYQNAKDGINQVNKSLKMCEGIDPSQGYGNCSLEGRAKLQKQLQDYEATLAGLSAYLQKQVDKGYIKIPLPHNRFSLPSTPLNDSYTLQALVSSAVDSAPSASIPPATTGFDNIDAKLAVIKNGANNALAESIKNSSNNLLAVNFVNTLMQGYNNTPIQLIDEVKSNINVTASLPSLFRNDVHTSLALASRYASFSFAPKVIQEDAQAQYPFISQATEIQSNTSEPLTSNSLWANAFGGANLLGNEVGASYGINLGYDKNLENALVGTYLSYEYATLKPSFLSLNAHNIKLGVYSRIQNGGNEIDLELSSLLSIISQESMTKALDSLSSANYLSSLTEIKTTYGYAFLDGDFKLKPLVGLALSFSYTPSFKESGDIIKEFSALNNFNTNLQVGLEFRNNFSNKGFLYTLLTIQQDLYNSMDSLTINSQSLLINQALKTYAQILLGGEIAVSKDWNIALSLGAKQSIVANKDEQNQTINETYMSGSVGVGYRF